MGPFPKLVTVREVMETIQRILDLPVVCTIMNALEVAMNAIISELGLDKLLVIPGLPDIQIDFAEEWVEDIKTKLSGVKDDIKGFTESMLKAVPDVCYPLPPTIAETFESVKGQFTLPENEITGRRQLPGNDKYAEHCLYMLAGDKEEMMMYMMEEAVSKGMAGQILFDEDIEDPRVQRRERERNQLDLDVGISLGVKVKTKYSISNKNGKKEVDFCIYAAALEDKCMAIKAEDSNEVTIFENVYKGTKFEETKCYRRTGAATPAKETKCYAAFGEEHSGWDVDKTINMYLIDKARCQNDCKKCGNNDFGAPTKTVRYTAKHTTNGLVDFSHRTLSPATGTSSEMETRVPFGCYRENGGFAFVPQGALEWDFFECLKRFKDDYNRDYELFFAERWTDTWSASGKCVQPPAFTDKSQRSKDWEICWERPDTPNNRITKVSQGTIVGNKDTKVDIFASIQNFFQWGDELCFVPTTSSCAQTDNVPDTDKFCTDVSNQGHMAMDRTLNPKINSDVQYFWFCFKHYLRGWVKQTGVAVKGTSGSLDNLEVVRSDNTQDCLPKANRRALMAPEANLPQFGMGRRLMAEASRRQMALVDGYEVADCPADELRFNVVIRGLNSKKIDFRVKDPENRRGIIRTNFDGAHGWSYFPGDDKLIAFDAGTARSFWNHAFAKGNYEFWINYETSDDGLNCYFDGVDNLSSTVRKGIWTTDDFTLSMYCDPASKISEFSTNESKGWKMVHLLEQPPTRLTIKGNFKVGDDVRFVPLNEPCTYGNSNNEHVDRQTFMMTSDNVCEVDVQVQSNIRYHICAREYGGEWVKQDNIYGANTWTDGMSIWRHLTDESGCPDGFTQNESGLCTKKHLRHRCTKANSRKRNWSRRNWKLGRAPNTRKRNGPRRKFPRL